MIFTWHHSEFVDGDPTIPVQSPTMAGGLFSIHKDFFQRLGRYDPGFDIWGGENLELSFKSWMCGGRLEILPCSHVGHIFRSRSPYKWRPGTNVLKKNSIRLAQVWLDDYKQIYFDRINNKLDDYGNITERLDLRSKLKCKRYNCRMFVICVITSLSSFQWYLENVYPEQFVPTKAVQTGVIRSATEGLCLSTPKGKKKDMLHKPVLSLPCKEFRNPVWNEQIWQFSGR